MHIDALVLGANGGVGSLAVDTFGAFYTGYLGYGFYVVAGKTQGRLNADVIDMLLVKISVNGGAQVFAASIEANHDAYTQGSDGQNGEIALETASDGAPDAAVECCRCCA